MKARSVAALILAAVAFSTIQSPIAWAQEVKAPAEAVASLGVGDKAPAIAVESFLKGEAVTEFKAGHIYVMEFWATWCGPCIAGMPHLAEVQTKFKDKATIIGVNIWEEKAYSSATIDRVKKFLDGKGSVMAYTVAYDGPAKAMDKAYMKAAGRGGIPCAFVIDGEGKVAYIGHPAAKEFEGTISQLVEGKFDMAAAKAAYVKQVEEERAEKAKSEQVSKLMRDAQKAFEGGNVEDGLAALDAAAKVHPESGAQIEFRKIRLLIDAGRGEAAADVSRAMLNGRAKDDWTMLANLATALSAPRRGAMGDLGIATQAAERAVELSEGKQPRALSALAGCQWAKGDKQAAIETQKKAVELSEGAAREVMQKTLDGWTAAPK
ncbi:MAG: redoxin domain-containing protein [Phycisphaerales bacterium]